MENIQTVDATPTACVQQITQIL